MTELRECPFCGSKSIDPQGWVSADNAGPACDDCGACADTVELWNTRPGERAAYAVAIKEAMTVIDDRRVSEAGLFAPKHSGQRGQARSDALYDAYQLVKKLA